MRIARFDLKETAPVVGDGAIAIEGWGEGRLIPVMIIDCAQHPALRHLILLHENTPPGDVNVTWFRRVLDKKHAYLRLQFLRPVATNATFSFRLEKYVNLIDGIIRARGVYLQPLESGHRVIQGLDKPKILVEIPALATFPGWGAIQRSIVMKSYLRRGMSREMANTLTDEHLKNTAELWAKRMRGSDDHQAT